MFVIICGIGWACNSINSFGLPHSKKLIGIAPVATPWGKQLSLLQCAYCPTVDSPAILRSFAKNRVGWWAFEFAYFCLFSKHSARPLQTFCMFFCGLCVSIVCRVKMLYVACMCSECRCDSDGNVIESVYGAMHNCETMLIAAHTLMK